MAVDFGDERSKVRIHAIVLTRNRPETLRRCLAAVLASTSTQDTVTILDDSDSEFFAVNAAVLEQATKVSPPNLIHVTTPRAKEALSRSVSMPAPVWMLRTAPRDIAPLRNLSLLLSVLVAAETTVLIDDDIHGFDLTSIHDKVDALASLNMGVVLGSEIRGIHESDLITKLSDAIDHLDKLGHGGETDSIRDLFQIRGDPGNESNCGYVSGGFMAFRIPKECCFAFPPGYNEDWIWCLLHGGNPRFRVMRTSDVIVHDPPSLRKPTREDASFELVGDLLFDCAEELRHLRDYHPVGRLKRFSQQFPGTDSMPANRVLELLEKASTLRQNGELPPVLDDYGLAVLSDMLRTGELAVDARQLLRDWSDDAVAKHESFAATLSNERTMTSLYQILQVKC